MQVRRQIGISVVVLLIISAIIYGFMPKPVAVDVMPVVRKSLEVTVEEEGNRLLLVPEGNTIGELVKALNAIGVTPRDLITILQAMKAAGALQAELVVI